MLQLAVDDLVLFPGLGLGTGQRFFGAVDLERLPGFDHRGQFGFQGGKRFVAGIGAIGFERILNRLVEFTESGLFFLIHRGRHHAAVAHAGTHPAAAGALHVAAGTGLPHLVRRRRRSVIFGSRHRRNHSERQRQCGQGEAEFVVHNPLLFRHLPDLFSRNLFN